jgi:hypothetical protein
MSVISGLCHEIDEKCPVPGYYAESSGNFLPAGPVFRGEEFLNPEDGTIRLQAARR